MKPPATPHDPYERLPTLYDLEHGSYEDDIDLYARFVEATGDPVLDLGCGTGRLLLPIAAAGYRVTGLDRSLPMLERARARAESEGAADRVTLFAGRMVDADEAPGGPFGLAIISLNGFLHVSTSADQRAVLRAVHRALDPRGQLIIDVFNPTADTLRAYDNSVVHEGVWTDEDGARVDKFAARGIAHATQTIHTELWYDRIALDGTLTRVTTSYEMRYVYRSELDLMLELAGFAEWHVYGSYDLDPFDDNAERLIVAAEVTPSKRSTRR